MDSTCCRFFLSTAGGCKPNPLLSQPFFGKLLPDSGDNRARGFVCVDERENVLILGFMLLVLIAPTFKTNTIAQNIRRQFEFELPPMSEPIPTPFFGQLSMRCAGNFQKIRPRMIAGLVFRVWEKIHVQPPGFAATVALLMVYLLVGFFAAVPWILPFVIQKWSISRGE